MRDSEHENERRIGGVKSSGHTHWPMFVSLNASPDRGPGRSSVSMALALGSGNVGSTSPVPMSR